MGHIAWTTLRYIPEDGNIPTRSVIWHIIHAVAMLLFGLVRAVTLTKVEEWCLLGCYAVWFL
jgi:hypothetical protein